MERFFPACFRVFRVFRGSSCRFGCGSALRPLCVKIFLPPSFCLCLCSLSSRKIRVHLLAIYRNPCPSVVKLFVIFAFCVAIPGLGCGSAALRFLRLSLSSQDLRSLRASWAIAEQRGKQTLNLRLA